MCELCDPDKDTCGGCRCDECIEEHGMCPACAGDVCYLCFAGLGGTDHCEHDVDDRHAWGTG